MSAHAVHITYRNGHAVSATTVPVAKIRPSGDARIKVGPQQPMGDIAVVVTCHAQYEKYLPGCLASIAAQTHRPDEVIVVCDGFRPRSSSLQSFDPKLSVSDYLPSLRVIEVSFHDPNAARNAGWRASKSEWVVHFDADNQMRPDTIERYVETITSADRRIAIVYGDLHITHDMQTVEWRREMPEYDYWQLRLQNCIDTSAAWRRVALESVGGWPDVPCRDDWSLAILITRNGWTAHKADGAAILYRRHDDESSRWDETKHRLPEAAWKVCTFAIVTLHSGRDDCLLRWGDWLANAELPPHTSLYVVDDSHDYGFRHMLREQIHRSEHRFEHVCVIPSRYRLSDDVRHRRGAGFSREIHDHVARLYNDVFAIVRDDFVLTLEDDVVPPLDAMGRLQSSMSHDWGFRQVAAVAAVYPARENPQCTVASSELDRWKPIRISEVRDEHWVAMCGWGCTLWHNALLRKCRPIQAAPLCGADATTCRSLHEMGGKIVLRGDVRCEHLLNPV